MKAIQKRIMPSTFVENENQERNSEKYGDEDILWRVHFDQFHLEMRYLDYILIIIYIQILIF